MKRMNRDFDEPVFNKCGFVTIDVGLKIWAFLRLFLELTGIGYLGFIMVVFTIFDGGKDFFKQLSIEHLMLLLILALVVDVGFNITLIVGLYKKNTSILRISYYYEMYAIAALILMLPITFYVLYTADPYFEGVIYYSSLGIIGILLVFAEVIVFLAVKSMLIQLLNKKQPGSVRIPYDDDYD